MRKLPSVLVSSVIRGTQLGESHGGLYLVDLDSGSSSLKLDWNRTDIDVSGRGGDRGLRGIAFHGARILVAANSQLLVLDQDFAVVEAFSNPYLRHCHEISVCEDRVFLTATGFDSLLVFDLKTKRFAGGWHLRESGNALQLLPFDPAAGEGPAAGHRFHINSVTASRRGLSFSGLRTPGLLSFDGRALGLSAQLPPGTHNAQLFDDAVLYNDTAADLVCCRRKQATIEFPVPYFDAKDIQNYRRFSSEVARPRFARGLCLLGEGLIAAGSSPSTICVYDTRGGTRITQKNLSMDVRNAVHGLAVWPFR